jgi:hypothetical protein
MDHDQNLIKGKRQKTMGMDERRKKGWTGITL